MIESFCHLADLASGSILDAEALRQLPHFTSGDTLHKGLLNHLNERGFTALTRGDEKWDIAALTDFGNHEIHRPHPGVQATGTVSTAITVPTA